MRMLGLLLIAASASVSLGQHHESNAARLMYNDFTLEDREIRIASKAQTDLYDPIYSVLGDEETQKLLQEYTERGSLYEADGETIIEANRLKSKGTQTIDPRTPPGFANPFYKKMKDEDLELITSQVVLDAIDGTTAEEWSSGFILLKSKGYIQQWPLERFDEFQTLYDASPNKIIRRVCESCLDSHKEIFYKRITPLPEGFTEILLNNWVSAGNTLNTDFTLHSTYQDAVDGTNGWTYCNYDTPNQGFPGECGPTGQTPDQWNYFDTLMSGQLDVAIFIEDANAEAADFYLSPVDIAIDEELANDPALAYKRGVCAHNPFRDRRRACFKACREVTSITAVHLCLNLKAESLRFKMHAWGEEQEQEEGTGKGLIMKATHALGQDIPISRGAY
mmetsp:Transcript_1845/g.2846  ORF Transcript_1845/g.2846 Transcript_1845/m.2846 type:complete len:392 (+) Transcript_1845:84-1259(+)